MSAMRQTNNKKHRFLHILKSVLVICLILIVLATLTLVTLIVISKLITQHQQNALQPFYNTNGLSTVGPPGQVVRTEPLSVNLSNGRASRIIYRTQRGDGTMTFSSGMVFIPNSPSRAPRPVVAWAHGTVGMGDSCAPSRMPNPVNNIGWVDAMLARGWVVTATDYAGLGTSGTEAYLVGDDEAHDVLNSVRAAISMPGSQAGSSFAIWGHSQGGNSALFSADEAASYAPELHLVGTVASAPAAELTALFSETSGSLDWVIGPEVMISWPSANPALDVRSILTREGYDNYHRIANQCITNAALGGLVRSGIGQKFFSANPVDVPSWSAMSTKQTAPILKPSQPLMVAESLDDKVVLPNTTALYIQRACNAGSNLTSLWLTGVGHIQLQTVISPQVISWLGDRFDGLSTQSSCNQPLPIPPAQQ